MSSDGSNAAKGLPGYRKTLTGKYYNELYDAPPAAPPDASGVPSTYGPLVDDPANSAPTQPDKYLRSMSTCVQCGSAFGSWPTDAASCPNCSDAQAMTSGLYTPGTPWF